jgi:hypothetical protein
MAQHDTWTGRTLGEPTAAQWKALQAFAARHGRNWKASLREAWMSGHYPDSDHDDNACLQQIRNTFGPRWLSLIDISKGK